ncbi:hypothetical protein RhiirA4_477960 [Rhizophagus irregularis]|uniref:Uncharacterized protein n=1 Tax=Rhizophagus irregularis TaxID=588596 RepID=A0A2I1HE45_9GLOM|nr:hypothetical protein RhiirA4_477960 [Rhizophagus irregularis]
MIQEQKNIWTSRCPGEIETKNYRKNNWIISALKALNNEKIKICDHEIKDFRENHRIKGGKIDLIDLIEAKDFTSKDKSGQVRKIKNEFIGQAQKENNHVNYFNENEKQDKNSIITWNDYGEYPIFSIDKKRSQKNEISRKMDRRKEEDFIKP